MLAVQHPIVPQVQLWDTRTLRHVGTPLPLSPNGENFLVSLLAFGPQEKTLRAIGGSIAAAGDRPSDSGSIFYTQSPLEPVDLVQGLCTRVRRNLTKREWALYIPELSYRRVCM